MRMKDLAARAVATAAVTVALVGLAPSTASAQEVEPAPQAAAAPAVALAVAEFQCGPNNWVGYLVPDNPPGAADFNPACQRHDRCYSVGSRTNRLDCDTRFRSDMLAACAASNPTAWCRTVAGTYYYAVRGAGSRFYQGSGLNN